MAKKLDHAKHNAETCRFLREDGKFLDWVVTTAFYAAIHYVDHALFPRQYPDPETGKVRRFESLDNLYRVYKNGSGNLDKHSYRTLLVDDIFPEFSIDFKKLRDLCSTARYNDYQVVPKIADHCVECLGNIKEICETTQPFS